VAAAVGEGVAAAVADALGTAVWARVGDGAATTLGDAVGVDVDAIAVALGVGEDVAELLHPARNTATHSRRTTALWRTARITIGGSS